MPGTPHAPVSNTLFQKMQHGRNVLTRYRELIIHFMIGYLLFSVGMALSAEDWMAFILGLLLLWVLLLNM